MPVLAIIVIAVIVIGGGVALTVPAVVSGPETPPTEVHGPVEPGIPAGDAAIETDSTYVDPYGLYPAAGSEEERAVPTGLRADDLFGEPLDTVPAADTYDTGPANEGAEATDDLWWDDEAETLPEDDSGYEVPTTNGADGMKSRLGLLGG